MFKILNWILIFKNIGIRLFKDWVNRETLEKPKTNWGLGGGLLHPQTLDNVCLDPQNRERDIYP